MRDTKSAVVGASARPGMGQAILRNLLDIGFTGELYAVNRKGEEVMGVKGYTSVLDIPADVDMAVCAVPSAGALQVIEECGKKGIGAVVCITAGFREIGGEGIEREKELVKLINKYADC